MTRPIKFRAWNKRIGKMVEFGEFWIGTNAPSTELRAEIKRTETQDNYDTDFDDADMEDTTLMQFTGLLDKNGVEIYESDLVKDIYEKVWEVQIRDLEDGVVLVNDKTQEASIAHVDGEFSLTECEVVGNKYENKG